MQGAETGGVLMVGLITSFFELVCQLFKTILIVHQQLISLLLQISLLMHGSFSRLPWLSKVNVLKGV